MTETRFYEPARLSTPNKALFSLKPLDATTWLRSLLSKVFPSTFQYAILERDKTLGTTLGECRSVLAWIPVAYSVSNVWIDRPLLPSSDVTTPLPIKRPEMSTWYRIALLLNPNSCLTFTLSTACSTLNKSVEIQQSNSIVASHKFHAFPRGAGTRDKPLGTSAWVAKPIAVTQWDKKSHRTLQNHNDGSRYFFFCRSEENARCLTTFLFFSSFHFGLLPVVCKFEVLRV